MHSETKSTRDVLSGPSLSRFTGYGVPRSPQNHVFCSREESIFTLSWFWCLSRAGWRIFCVLRMFSGGLWAVLGMPLGSLGVTSGAQVAPFAQYMRRREPLGSFWNAFGVSLGCFWDTFGVPLGHSRMSLGCPWSPSELDLQPFRSEWVSNQELLSIVRISWLPISWRSEVKAVRSAARYQFACEELAFIFCWAFDWRWVW